jgi:hypothetical protein
MKTDRGKQGIDPIALGQILYAYKMHGAKIGSQPLFVVIISAGAGGY